MGRVVVVGSLNVDRPWRVDRHPSVGQTIVGDMLPPLPGGKGLNQAVAASRMGVATEVVGTVGDDADGRWLVEVARGEGIGTRRVAPVPGTPTGSALIVIDALGANTVTVSGGANRRLTVDDLGLRRGDVLVTQFEVPAETVASALEQARAAGARSILNPSPGPAGDAEALIERADIVVVNQHEREQLRASAAAPGHELVVTLGADGVEATGSSGHVRLAGVEVEVVDTTGAGDCFLGVLAAGLVEGRPWRRCLERANRAAALAATRLGTVSAMPYADELGVSDAS